MDFKTAARASAFKKAARTVQGETWLVDLDGSGTAIARFDGTSFTSPISPRVAATKSDWTPAKEKHLRLKA